MNFVCCIGRFGSPSLGIELGYTAPARMWQPYLQIHAGFYTFTLGWIEEGGIEFEVEDK